MLIVFMRLRRSDPGAGGSVYKKRAVLSTVLDSFKTYVLYALHIQERIRNADLHSGYRQLGILPMH